MICGCTQRFCKMEQSILRHFIFINNPAFSFRPRNNPNAVRSHVACGQACQWSSARKGRAGGGVGVTPECC